jgi:hypothetical protein
VFDAIEMFDPTGVARLKAYAKGADVSLPGFWSDEDIEKGFDLLPPLEDD